jgi:hypothetical protein
LIRGFNNLKARSIMSVGFRVDLLSAAAATGTAKRWVGERAALLAWGTFDGATVALQVSPDNGTTWLACEGARVAAASLTAAGTVIVDVPAGLSVRAAITSAGAGTVVSASLVQIDATS